MTADTRPLRRFVPCSSTSCRGRRKLESPSDFPFGVQHFAHYAHERMRIRLDCSNLRWHSDCNEIGAAPDAGRPLRVGSSQHGVSVALLREGHRAAHNRAAFAFCVAAASYPAARPACWLSRFPDADFRPQRAGRFYLNHLRSAGVVRFSASNHKDAGARPPFRLKGRCHENCQST